MSSTPQRGRAGGITRSSLPSSLRESLVLPSDPGYGPLRHTYSYRGSPAAVLRPRTTGAVVDALSYATASTLPLSVRSGGHGISSASTNDGGIVLDLSAMNTVEVLHPGAGLVRIGAGARWGEVARALSPSGLAVSSGDSGDVGVGGLATAGGIGLMGRKHGLTIDSMTAATVLTADGTVLTASAAENPDLFWAVRGAGANFGIVTDFEFTAARVPGVISTTVQYDTSDTAGFLQRWGDAVEAAPREITAFLYLFAGSTAGMASIVYAGLDADAARRALAPFLALAPLLGGQSQAMPYAELVTSTHAPHTGAVPLQTRSGLAVHLDAPIAVRLAGMLSSGTAATLQIRAVGGRINDVDADATAYGHRHQNFSVFVGADPARRGDLWREWEELHPHLDGLYLSFEMDKDPRRLADAFPTATLTRLRGLKAVYDPAGLFNANFPLRA
ncbi:FAD-binding oxidoreductase [Arthrobacter zhaoguopingii]|uniref:FAD-binding oxidoreductase n=1 Tax=Arthrobacter zhaoguopingii TaxID=2681491 RepID=UPI0013581488|nr:FAD-binding oxidoreductase [Arthrobacter zhaoguopingii]